MFKSKLISFLLLLFSAFNANAITVNYDSDSAIISKEELFNMIDNNFNNPKIAALDKKYRLFSRVDTKLTSDGTGIYFANITLQKNIVDKATGKKYWVDIKDRYTYGSMSSKEFVQNQILDLILNHVNTWKLEN